jgi:hypothetical protein
MTELFVQDLSVVKVFAQDFISCDNNVSSSKFKRIHRTAALVNYALEIGHIDVLYHFIPPLQKQFSICYEK